MRSQAPRRPLPLIGALAAAVLACATSRATSPVAALPPPSACPTCPAPASLPAPKASPPDKEADLRFPEEEVVASKLDLELSGKNDEELFLVGSAAYGAKDYARSAAAFARLADLFSSSPHLATALFNAGLAYEQLEEWRLALERFIPLARDYEGKDALEAAFKMAECQYQLRELGDAKGTLAAIAARKDLPLPERVRVWTQLGVVELEDGHADDAERSLRKAVVAAEGAGDAERLDPYYPAQAEYYLGETYRGWFESSALDPSQADEQELAKALEQKSELLLSAQGHYLCAIRLGDDRWAVASGYRVGELYDQFRRQLLDAPLPPGLDAEAQEAYRALLKSRVRVLAAKAVSAYEAALLRASRSGVEDLRFLSEAQGSLERLKLALSDGGEKS